MRSLNSDQEAGENAAALEELAGDEPDLSRMTGAQPSSMDTMDYMDYGDVPLLDSTKQPANKRIVLSDRLKRQVTLRKPPLVELYNFYVANTVDVSSATRALWFAGAAITLMEMVFFMYLSTTNYRDFPEFNRAEAKILTSLIFFTLFGWGYAFDLGIWRSHAINYAQIFKFKGRTLSSGEAAKVCSVLALSQGLTTAFLACLSLDRSASDANRAARSAALLACILLHACYLLSPVLLPFRHATICLRNSLARSFTPPFHPVSMLDNIVSDALTSAVGAMLAFEYGLCALFVGGWWSDGPGLAPKLCGAGSLHNQIVQPLLSLLPFIIRFLQCLRRAWDARDIQGWARNHHFVNAGKYLSAIAVVVSGTVNFYAQGNDFATEWTFYRFLWLACAIIKTVYCAVWDVSMDWGLGNIGNKDFFLRDMLTMPKSYYYFFIFNNLCARAAWTLAITPREAPESWSFALQTVEILRRIQWLVLRIEKEWAGHLKTNRFDPDAVRVLTDKKIKPLLKQPSQIGSENDAVIGLGLQGDVGKQGSSGFSRTCESAAGQSAHAHELLSSLKGKVDKKLTIPPPPPPPPLPKVYSRPSKDIHEAAKSWSRIATAGKVGHRSGAMAAKKSEVDTSQTLADRSEPVPLLTAKGSSHRRLSHSDSWQRLASVGRAGALPPQFAVSDSEQQVQDEGQLSFKLT